MAELLLELSADALTLLLVALTLFFLIGRHVHRRWIPGWRAPGWLDTLRLHRLRVLFALVALLVAVEVSEEVVDRESGELDEGVLRWLRHTIPSSWTAAVTWVTDSGSMRVLLPASVLLAAALASYRRRFEALLLLTTMTASTLFILVVKRLVGRARPELWDTEWYWGSSFPSGHTLSTAAFATALVLIARRLWPGSRPYAVTIAAIWILAVALSRLILGVHWPTDVLAAAAIGSVLPLLVAGIARALRFRWRQRGGASEDRSSGD